MLNVWNMYFESKNCIIIMLKMLLQEVINVYINFCSIIVVVKGFVYFGVGIGQIWMDDFYCDGIEFFLDICYFRSWGINNCGYNEDFSVICIGKQRYKGKQG